MVKQKSNNKFNYLNTIKECYKSGIDIASIVFKILLLSYVLIELILCNMGLIYYMITGQTIKIELYLGIPILISPLSILIGVLYFHFNIYLFYKKMSSNRHQSEDMLLEDAMKIQEYSVKIDKTVDKVTVILGITIFVNIIVTLYAFGVYLVFFR